MKKIERKPLQINRVPPGHVAPKFGTLLTAHPEGDSPIVGMPDMEEVGANVDAEVSEVLVQIVAAKRERRDMYRTLTDNNFYLVVCFQSGEQRDEFAEKAGWKHSGAFVDGLDVAQRLRVDIKPVALPRKENRAMPVALRGHKIVGDSTQKGGDSK